MYSVVENKFSVHVNITMKCTVTSVFTTVCVCPVDLMYSNVGIKHLVGLYIRLQLVAVLGIMSSVFRYYILICSIV
jgi:hypothetical protein